MPLPRWMSDKNLRQRQNRRSAKQEHDRAKKTNAKAQPGSGSSPSAPHDVKQLGDSINETLYLEELKYTDKRRFAIDLDYWHNFEKAALAQGREPRMIIQFSDGTELWVEPCE